MIAEDVLYGERIQLRSLCEEDVSIRYVEWLNDPKVNRYLETRFEVQSLESCKHFVHAMADSKCDYLFGIFTRNENQHIGNIKLGAINFHHKSAQLSLLIGESTLWGKGYATEAIKTLSYWGLRKAGFEKIEAGCYEQNLSSLRAFIKCGYQVEGFFRHHFLSDKKRVGSFWLGLTPRDIADDSR